METAINQIYQTRKGSLSMPELGRFQFNIIADESQPLSDVGPRGKERPWAEHRSTGDLLAMIYQINQDNKKAERLRGCADIISFAVDEEGKKRLNTAWFCRVRLCPICQWRRSLKVYGQAIEIMKLVDRDKPHGWIMLNLTVRNVDGCDLENELNLLNESWRRMTRSSIWKKTVLGSMRSIEVTHNLEIGDNYDTYHPHIHSLLCVEQNYFSGHHYLSREAWTKLWIESAKLSYWPQVFVRRIRGCTAGALAEVAKYATKPGSYILPDDLDMMSSTVQVLDRALNKRRLVSWQGNLKKAKQELKLDDIDSGDLIHTSEKELELADNEHLEFYKWIAAKKIYGRERIIEQKG